MKTISLLWLNRSLQDHKVILHNLSSDNILIIQTIINILWLHLFYSYTLLLLFINLRIVLDYTHTYDILVVVFKAPKHDSMSMRAYWALDGCVENPNLILTSFCFFRKENKRFIFLILKLIILNTRGWVMEPIGSGWPDFYKHVHPY